MARIIADAYRVERGSLRVCSELGLNGSVVAWCSCDKRISIAADIVNADGHVWVHYTTYNGAARCVAIGVVSAGEKVLGGGISR